MLVLFYMGVLPTPANFIIKVKSAVDFQEKLGEGAKGLNLPSILEETRLLDKYLGIFVDCIFFHKKRCTRELRLKQETTFLLKNRVFGLGFHHFCREIARSFGTWGTLCLPLPPIAATGSNSQLYVLVTRNIVNSIWGSSGNLFSKMQIRRFIEKAVILVILDAEIVYYICKLGTNVGRKD